MPSVVVGGFALDACSVGQGLARVFDFDQATPLLRTAIGTVQRHSI